MTSALTAKIQFELPIEKVREMEEMMRLTGITTRKEFFNNALTLLAWAIHEMYMGNIIASIDEKNKKFKEVVMPILANAAKAAN